MKSCWSTNSKTIQGFKHLNSRSLYICRSAYIPIVYPHMGICLASDDLFMRWPINFWWCILIFFYINMWLLGKRGISMWLTPYFCLKVGSIEGRVGVHHIDDAQSSKNFTFKCHREGNDIFSVNSLNFHPVRSLSLSLSLSLFIYHVPVFCFIIPLLLLWKMVK
jgi:hypothetical protein